MQRYLTINEVIDEARQAIQQAVEERHKVAMFHFQVLKHAKNLQTFSAKRFCRLVEVKESYYVSEYEKMLALAKLMESKAVQLSNKRKKRSKKVVTA